MTFEPRLQLVPYGSAAVAALARRLRLAQGDDPLAAVTVVMPSTHAGITVRRRLVRDHGGLLNVQFVSMPQLAGLLAAPLLAHDGRQLLTPVRRAALIRKLLEGVGHPFHAFRGPAIERSLDATFAELAELDEQALTRQAATGRRSEAVIDLYRRFRDAAGDDVGEQRVTTTAATAVQERRSDLNAVGHVVLFLPRRVRPSELELLDQLGQQGRLSALIGLSGSETADRESERLAGALARSLGPVERMPTEGPTPSSLFIRAPDAEEEVRAAIRVVLDALPTTPADRIALVSRVGEPYHRLLTEQLAAAGIAHHAPGSLRLAQTAAGRALVGMLTLPLRGFRRAEVFRCLASSPLRGPSGKRVRVGQLDRVARRSGVSSGVEQWHERLDARRHELSNRRADAVTRDDADAVGRADQQLGELDDLRRTFDWLVDRCTPPPDADWRGLARWADDTLVGLLGEPSRQLDWPDDDLAAYEAVRATLGELSALDTIEPGVTPELFARVVLDELERPARPVGAFGKGVFVGALAELVGADHDLVVILGMAETRHPPRGADDPLIPDHDRGIGGGVLAARRPPRADEHRDHLAAIASASQAVLSFARADTRAGREQLPSRWWLAALSDAVGRPVTADDLAGDAVTTLPSFVAAPSSGATSTTAAEHLTSLLLRACDEHGRDALPVFAASIDPKLARGAAAVHDRFSGTFSEWTGLVGPDLAAQHDPTAGVASATRYETWAACPFRYFLRSVLEVRPLDDRGDAESISGLDRGTLVHAVLERFHGDDIPRPPDEGFTVDDIARLRRLVVEVGEQFQDRGLTGRPLLWQLEAEAIVRRLEHTVLHDGRYRVERGLRPAAVELAFGDDVPTPAVEIELADDRVVKFRGMVDRVDVSDDETRLVVFDYKTGKPRKYKERGDITWRGQHLQLTLYAEAARLRFPHAEQVESYFWFVDSVNRHDLVGGPVGPAEQARLRAVLQTIVDGIDNGWFPANPGEESYFGYEHCGWCEYQRVCPTSRGDLWEEVRLAPQLERYTDMAEGELPAPDRDDLEAVES